MPRSVPGFEDTQIRQAAGQVLVKAWKGADEARSRWHKQGSEVARYGYAPNFDFEYTSLPVASFFKGKVALTSEAIRLFGPYLYQKNPHRTVLVRPWADQFMGGSAGILGDYLNYALTEYDAYANARRCVDQAICWGRAVRWTGLHPKKPEIVCSLMDDVRNFWDDPDAEIPEERRIIFRQRIRPREELLAEYPDAERAIMGLQLYTDPQAAKDDNSWDAGNSGVSGASLVCYLEAYSIVGLHRFKGGEVIGHKLGQMGQAVEDKPLKYLFDKGGKFIHACEWEVPYYIDGEWPVSELDFYDYPGSLWPVSPLESGLFYQRAINWLVTLMVSRTRKAMRMIGATVKTAGEGLNDTQEDQVLVGEDYEMLNLSVSGGRSLKDFIHEFTPSFEWMAQGMQWLAALEDRYRKATGTYDILFTGATDTQSRTATDAQMKDRNSQSRLDDMRDRIIKWETRIARKEALAARFLLKRDEIGAVLGPQAAQQWGFLVAPDQMSVKQFAIALVQQGMPPQEAVAMAQEKFSQAVDLRRWAAETDYGVEADSIRRRDIDQQIDTFKELMNQFVPAQIQSPDPRIAAIGYKTAAGYLNAVGAAPELVQEYKDLAAAIAATPMAPPVIPGAASSSDSQSGTPMPV